MASKYAQPIIIENARIIFRNFSGKEGKFNREGDRNFCVVIEDENVANQLNEDGWNVKVRPARDEGDAPLYYIQVKVAFDPYPPTVYLVTNTNKTQLWEDTIGMLDDADIRMIDLTIRPYTWETATGSGIKAYLKEMFVTINESPYAHKYANLGAGADDKMPWDFEN